LKIRCLPRAGPARHHGQGPGGGLRAGPAGPRIGAPDQNKVNTLSIKIADFIIRVDSAVGFRQFNDFGFYKHFVVSNGIPYDCRLKHRIGLPPDLAPDNNPFYTQNWQLAASGDNRVLRVGPPPRKGKADNVVVFGEDYKKGAMYQKSVIELFRRFIDQFLIINLLSRNRGFLLHASGVVWQEKGICFAGPSGAGKSTLLNLFRDEVSREALLNDDRLALRNYGNRWRVFGTPWYGESRVSSANAADLSAIFFIRHSKRNYIRKLSASQICPQLMVLGLLPLWDKSATSAVLATFGNLIQNIPAFELGFLPGKGAVDLIKKTL
jgi:hypothetical protein